VNEPGDSAERSATVRLEDALLPGFETTDSRSTDADAVAHDQSIDAPGTARAAGTARPLART
jgi:hypothetical protein